MLKKRDGICGVVKANKKSKGSAFCKKEWRINTAQLKGVVGRNKQVCVGGCLQIKLERRRRTRDRM